MLKMNNSRFNKGPFGYKEGPSRLNTAKVLIIALEVQQHMLKKVNNAFRHIRSWQIRTQLFNRFNEIFFSLSVEK